MRLIGWQTGQTTRSQHLCEPITAACIVARKLCYPTRWRNVVEMLGMHSSKFSETFWKAVESLVQTRRDNVTSFRHDLATERTVLYS